MLHNAQPLLLNSIMETVFAIQKVDNIIIPNIPESVKG